MAQLNSAEHGQFTPTSFEALPAGDCVLIITDSSVGAPKNNPKDEMVTLKATVVEGVNGVGKGRVMFLRFLTRYLAKKQVQDINRSRFYDCKAAIVGADKAPHVKDTIELHNIPFRVRLKHRKGQDGELENEVAKYYPRDPKSAGPALAVAAAAHADSAPWASKAAGGDGVALMDGSATTDAAPF